ncbi:UDP-N-acetylglucosamine--N-acetylmuramyl-(pentapeptide) pyrophosphoryl-undecaprenol N-acetylglucosamine transferase [Methanolobus psychrotolerans]|uniref:UDP-N-acetylglucosamine--N-acetylmuramyl- (pentapeptide) pyrophosphoryl-undecaprenol N-acetylglucosamine transferase n=1 Tax=Methanolobus psychrotolerans TaxID=1874706 RepID=UPI000B9158F8|nr:glycosyltransferase [Methanolobus psychrotolerans]
MKFLIFVCGEGLGHTGRCISLANELLAAGHSVCIGAYGYSGELIERSGHRTRQIPRELNLTGNNGSLDLKSSIVGTAKSISITDMRSVLNLVEITKPDFVISDGYYLGILASMWRKVRTCMIVNQSNMQDFFRGKGFMIRFVGSFVRRFYTWIYKRTDLIFVPDFPLPFAICASNLAFPYEVWGKIEFSGPLLRKRFGEVTAKEGVKHPHVLCSIGGFGYRLQIFRTITKAAKMDPSISYTLIGGPDLDYDMLGEIPENVNLCRFVADPFPYYRSSDVVICTGGHGTLTESLSFGLPVISFPDQLHNEQENNARRVEENGYGISLSYSVSPEELLHAVHSLLHDEKFKSKASKLKEHAQSLDGPGYIRKKLETYYTMKTSGLSFSALIPET